MHTHKASLTPECYTLPPLHSELAWLKIEILQEEITSSRQPQTLVCRRNSSKKVKGRKVIWFSHKIWA